MQIEHAMAIGNAFMIQAKLAFISGPAGNFSISDKLPRFAGIVVERQKHRESASERIACTLSLCDRHRFLRQAADVSRDVPHCSPEPAVEKPQNSF